MHFDCCSVLLAHALFLVHMLQLFYRTSALATCFSLLSLNWHDLCVRACVRVCVRVRVCVCVCVLCVCVCVCVARPAGSRRGDGFIHTSPVLCVRRLWLIGTCRAQAARLAAKFLMPSSSIIWAGCGTGQACLCFAPPWCASVVHANMPRGDIGCPVLAITEGHF